MTGSDPTHRDPDSRPTARAASPADAGPAATGAAPKREAPGKDSLPLLHARLFSGYLIVLNIALLWLLVSLWPEAVPLDAGGAGRVSLVGLFDFAVGAETRLLLIVIAAGALGSYIHLATSFADYTGNRRLVRSWLTWYTLRPFIGTALAVIVYFALRGGLVLGSDTAGALSPYGVAAVAALTGMFSKQAADKLREVFENLFQTERVERADPLPVDAPSGPVARPAPDSSREPPVHAGGADGS